MSRERTPKPIRGVPSLDGLIAALAEVPRLDGAACKGHAPLFDLRPDADDESGADRIDRHRRALALCQTCPARQMCETWADTHSPGRLHGVVGGRVRNTFTDRPDQRNSDDRSA